MAAGRQSEGGVRLNKYLADNGIASRRKADELIAAGEVMVDGEIVTEMGLKVDPARQRVEIDGVVLKPEGQKPRYYLLYKPEGVVCTADPREARKRAVDLVGDRNAGRLFTVGRLDEDSSGLILLTNDGEFANLVAHPRYGVPKLYKVVVRGRLSDEALREARSGVRLSEGLARFESVGLRKRSEKQSVLLVGLKEGKNRQIRRVFAKLGHKVNELARVRIGNLTDRGMRRGDWRPLAPKEVRELIAIAKGELEPEPVNQRAEAAGRSSRAPGKKGSRPGGRPPKSGGPPRRRPPR
jgi:23S rRNA pseudouridine2605 synthase